MLEPILIVESILTVGSIPVVDPIPAIPIPDNMVPTSIPIPTPEKIEFNIFMQYIRYTAYLVKYLWHVLRVCHRAARPSNTMNQLKMPQRRSETQIDALSHTKS